MAQLTQLLLLCSSPTPAATCAYSDLDTRNTTYTKPGGNAAFGKAVSMDCSNGYVSTADNKKTATCSLAAGATAGSWTYDTLCIDPGMLSLKLVCVAMFEGSEINEQ